MVKCLAFPKTQRQHHRRPRLRLWLWLWQAASSKQGGGLRHFLFLDTPAHSLRCGRADTSLQAIGWMVLQPSGLTT